MSSSELQSLTLSFGVDQQIVIQVNAEALAGCKPEVPWIPDRAAALDEALREPLDFPPLEQCVIPGDHVALALDPLAAELPEMVAAVWRVLARRGVQAADVHLVQPAVSGHRTPTDPRSRIDPETAGQMSWTIHDPREESNCAYVASTAAGDRLYLSRPVVEADVAIAVGQISHDPLIGYRGGPSAFYPALSRQDAIQRASGQGHDELGPEDERPLRQLMDEVGWLLGSQFTVQSVRASRGGAVKFLAGAPESVIKSGRLLLAQHWQLELDERPELIVAAVERSASSNGWSEAAAALATCRNLVARGGKIVLLTDLHESPGPGIELIRTFETPREALKPLRSLAPDDLIAATQFAAATDWARCFLLSRLDSDLVESLFCVPVEKPEEVQRLLTQTDRCLTISSAQDVYGRIRH